jgi:GntR family transcriptional regulator/MocR family aminotransferase
MFRQVYEFLQRAIISGSLPPGSRLPSTRAVAACLGISRNTALNAYELLAADGFLAGKIGSGTRVSQVVAVAPLVPAPNVPDTRLLMRLAHYPAAATGLHDPDGTPLYICGLD